MSVQIKDLTKIYGERKALDGISFEAENGKVTGFLGPNGAGKTTTMKILSCFIGQDGGQAQVCGFNTRSHPEEVKRSIGYLPEHNPLYKDMYVKEYLRFVAGMYGLPNKKSKVAEMIEMTGLGLEQNKKIAALSKGYRQRVGLAQALIHDPKVLILDEPTSGLDPNQLADIRNLIIQLGKEKTVILSTHIMQEVEAVCDQVVIINEGNIVANGSLSELKERASGKGIQITVGFDNDVRFDLKFGKKEGVKSIQKGNIINQWIVTTESDVDLRPDIFRFAVDNKITLLELTRNAYEVEDVFRIMTRQ